MGFRNLQEKLEKIPFLKSDRSIMFVLLGRKIDWPKKRMKRIEKADEG